MIRMLLLPSALGSELACFAYRFANVLCAHTTMLLVMDKVKPRPRSGNLGYI